ncbi:MAG: type II toxin-antitoxin system RelE/ParE family toxin [Phycisphaerae bacterium]|nr:type II toxin-antitoxin system RelE/ParE family toxin [Tepidisphaeraceae bacterium]
MTRQVRLLPAARREYDDAVVWYESGRAGEGEKFLVAVRETLGRIAAARNLHQVVYRAVRRAVVTGYPYIVLYQDLGDEVIVISVFHTSRNPSIWKKRV